MKDFGDWIARGIPKNVLAMTGRRSPWGGSGDDGSDGSGASSGSPSASNEPEDEEPEADKPAGDTPPAAPPKGPRNPWLPQGETPPRRSASIEDIFRARKAGQKPGSGGGNNGSGGGGFGRGGGGFGPGGPSAFFNLPVRPDGKSWMPLIIGGIAAMWLLVTTSHQLGSTEEGIVTTFGKYTRTINAGLSFTLPWPIQDVKVVDVTSIRRDSIPEGDGEKLMLTSDQNLVDFSYLVRWNIKDLKLYNFQLADPDATIREAAEAAMRASVAEVKLNAVMGGSGRAEIEQKVRLRMQGILDAYHAGVLIQGVDIKKADPPAKVIGSFQQVTVAQQGAQKDMSNAQAFAQQIIARAQGDAAAFDKVYAQYKLAPEVTRRRMYYETMERVLSANDKVVAPSNVTSWLPLPELRRKAAAAPEAVGPTTTVTGGQ